MYKMSIDWRGPVYNTSYDYSKRGMVKHIAEKCRGKLLLNVKIIGAPEEFANELITKLLDKLNNSDEIEGNDHNSTLLSNESWANCTVYDPDTETYVDALCINRDFDNTDLQKKVILGVVKAMAKQIRRELVFRERQSGALVQMEPVIYKADL